MSHRERLLAAARRCLVTQGYAHTTARDLVAQSDTNLGSISYHFGSKDALMQAALTEAMAEYTAKVLAAGSIAGGETGGEESVRRAWVATVAAFGETRELTISFLEALTQSERSPELRQRLAAAYRELRTSVRHGLDQADIGNPERRDAVASFMMAVCDGLILQWMLDPDAVPDGDELFAAARSVFAR